MGIGQLEHIIWIFWIKLNVQIYNYNIYIIYTQHRGFNHDALGRGHNWEYKQNSDPAANIWS